MITIKLQETEYDFLMQMLDRALIYTSVRPGDEDKCERLELLIQTICFQKVDQNHENPKSFDELLRETSKKIAGHEREILNEYCKANIAAFCLKDGKDLVDILKDYRINIQNVFEGNTIIMKYWFDKIENGEKR